MKQTINNILTKVALAATLLFSLSALPAWADTSTSTLTFTAACGGSGTADDNVVWTVTSDAAESTYDSTKGIHYGTSRKEVSYLRLTTSGISGTITQIVVNASGASKTSAILNVTVGGSAFGDEKSLTSSAANYTLTGSASGEIVVSITQSSANKALYCKSITVTYTSGGSQETCATPTFSPAAGSYSTAQNVTISTTTEGATIYYTTDGTDPTSASSAYTSAISVNQNTTIKAIAVKDGLEDSEIASASYTIKCATPTFNPAAGAYTETQNVTLSCATADAVIHYTINGSAPSSESAVYSAPISVSENTTIKAIAIKTGLENSEIASASYTIETPVPGYSISFESSAAAYTDWVFDNMTSKQSGSITAYEGSYYGTTGGKSSASITTKEKVANPKSVTCRVSKQSTNITESNWKIQYSSDGENWTDAGTRSATNMDQGKWVVFTSDDLTSHTDVFVRVYYSGSTAVRNIDDLQLTEDVPSVIPASTSIEVDDESTEGTLNLAYTKISDTPNLAIHWYTDNTGAELGSKPSWVSTAEFNSDKNFHYVTATNTAKSSRSAYFKVSAVGKDDSTVYSDLVTITQSGATTLASYSLYSGDLVEGDYIIYYDGYALNNIVESDRLQYELVTPSKDIITTDNPGIVWHIAPSGNYWTIYNAAVNAYAASTGGKNKAQLLADGTDDKSLWEASGSSTYEFVNKKNKTDGVNANLRNNTTNGFACYSTSTGGALSLYKLEDSPNEINITATLSEGHYWSTFYYNSTRYSLPDGAQAFTMDASNQLHRVGSDGSIIPAKTAVVIISKTPNITLTKNNSTDAITITGTNILKGSNYEVEKSGTVYVLGVDNGVIGFYQFSGKNIPANKAYYNE